LGFIGELVEAKKVAFEKAPQNFYVASRQNFAQIVLFCKEKQHITILLTRSQNL
jgi:hypothetical protein